MRYLLCALAFLCVNVYGQPNAKEIITQANARIKQLKSIAYNIYDETFGVQSTADVVIQREKPFPVFGVSKLRLMGMVMDKNGTKTISLAYDGNKFEFLNYPDYQVVRLDSPSYPKLSRTGQFMHAMLLEAAYFEKHGLDSLIKTIAKETYMGDTVIFNTDCHKINIHIEREDRISGKVSSESTWYFGKNDLLIRGRVSKYGKSFMNIKAVDKEYPHDFFSIAASAPAKPSNGSSNVKTITGLEPISGEMLPLGTKAPDWTLPSSTGKNITLSKLKGKVVLLDFWGTWCLPCIRAMPDIQAIYDHFKSKDVEVIGVSVEMEKAVDPIAFAKRKGFTYPIVVNGETISKSYKIVQFPGVYIIDKTGKIIHAEHGANRENFKEDIIKRIEGALMD